MKRQSISFTKPNDEWLKAQVDSEEYSSKSELINDLVRQARNAQVKVDFIRAKLDESENSGFTEDENNHSRLFRGERPVRREIGRRDCDKRPDAGDCECDL